MQELPEHSCASPPRGSVARRHEAGASGSVDPGSVDSDSAAVVSISSIAAKVGIPKRLSYTAAKAGIEGLTRVLAVVNAA